MENKNIIEKQREIFKGFMQRHRLNANAWAKKSGVTEATIRHYLNGRTQSLTGLVLEKLAGSAGASVADLIVENQYLHDQETKEFLSFDRELMLQTLINVEAYVRSADIKLSVEEKANVFMAWYDLAKLLKLEKKENPHQELINTLMQKIG